MGPGPRAGRQESGRERWGGGAQGLAASSMALVARKVFTQAGRATFATGRRVPKAGCWEIGFQNVPVNIKIL